MSQINIDNTDPARPVQDSGQVNVNMQDPTPVRRSDGGMKAVATDNLTWAIALVLIIAAVAVAIVFVVHNI